MPGIPGPALPDFMLCNARTVRPGNHPFRFVVMRRFFWQAADIVGADHPVAAEKLRRASPQGMRYMHATLARGAELTIVRDNLRHSSLATTSICLQSDEIKRARQMSQAFAAR